MSGNTSEKKRTLAQNRAMHKWFTMIADELNGAGFEQKITIGTIDTPWNNWSVKAIFKKIAVAQFGVYHTADLTTKQLLAVQETLNRALAEKGIHIPWPNIQELLLNADIKQTGRKPLFSKAKTQYAKKVQSAHAKLRNVGA